MCGGCEVQDGVPRVRPAPRREVRHLGWHVRAGAPPHPPPACPRPARPRERLGRLIAGRPRSRPAAGAPRPTRASMVDLRVEPGPGQELVGAPVELAPGTSPTSSTRRDVGVLAAREVPHLEARGLDAGALEVDEVHRHLRSPVRLEHEKPSARTPGQPAVALADLTRDAARDRDVAGREHTVDRDERLARADRGRAEASGAERRDRSRAPES